MKHFQDIIFKVLEYLEKMKTLKWLFFLVRVLLLD